MLEAQCVIDGRTVSGAVRAGIVNPARRDEVVGTYPVLTAADVDEAVMAAEAAGPAWRALTAVERVELIRSATAAVQALELHHTLVGETGRAVAEAQGESMALAFMVDFFGAMAASIDEGEVVLDDENGVMKVFREPFGVVGATVPWNAPLWQASGKILPALITGNTVVLKPSPVAPLAVLEFARTLNEFLPPGVLNTVAGEDLVVGSALFGHPGVRMTTFTGGIGGGKAAAVAGADTFTRMILELGGNDPAVILDDQPITEHLCSEMAASSFFLTGQACINVKRIYVPRDRVEELATGILKCLESYVIGDGADPGTTIGPLTNEAQFKRVVALTESAVVAGGKVRYAGTVTGDETRGFYLRPAVVTGLDEAHPLVAEEQFGPVLPIQGYDSVEEAIELANATEYGLTASVWSPDPQRAEQVARRLQAGGSTINVHSVFGVNMTAPYGGVKMSGLGREYGEMGFLAYTEPHVVSTWRAPSS